MIFMTVDLQSDIHFVLVFFVIALPMLDSDEVFLAISCFRVEILKMVFKDFLKKSQNSHLF